MTTKERILNIALNLFSERGYSAVYVTDIAEEVGIKAPSLYKHFKSKEDIFESCINCFYAKMEDMHKKLLPQADQEIKFYKNIEENELLMITDSLFDFYLTDDVASKFRKMLIVERYRNKKLNLIFEKLFIEGAVEHQTAVFRKLIQAGVFKKSDPKILAFHFYTPIFFLLQKYDLHPEKIDEAFAELAVLIHDFHQKYGIKK
ncbi:TetR/AcrR family transcriptional regulator [Treponema maltophilum]|uniref:TetR/AcrR family transcriptional regulator n=1 Tax=Treponema maltophilum TaxID=51160 RepID=UPI003D8B0C5C